MTIIFTFTWWKARRLTLERKNYTLACQGICLPSLANSLGTKATRGVAFQSKTNLIEHYENTLGAIHVGGHKMIIFPEAALKLIRQYFQT